jgi:hypothetical protein
MNASERYGYGELKQGVWIKRKVPKWVRDAFEKERGSLSLAKWFEQLARDRGYEPPVDAR